MRARDPSASEGRVAAEKCGARAAAPTVVRATTNDGNQIKGRLRLPLGPPFWRSSCAFYFLSNSRKSMSALRAVSACIRRALIWRGCCWKWRGSERWRPKQTTCTWRAIILTCGGRIHGCIVAQRRRAPLVTCRRPASERASQVSVLFVALRQLELRLAAGHAHTDVNHSARGASEEWAQNKRAAICHAQELPRSHRWCCRSESFHFTLERIRGAPIVSGPGVGGFSQGARRCYNACRQQQRC